MFGFISFIVGGNKSVFGVKLDFIIFIGFLKLSFSVGF